MSYSARAPWTHGAASGEDERRERPVWTREEFLERSHVHTRGVPLTPGRAALVLGGALGPIAVVPLALLAGGELPSGLLAWLVALSAIGLCGALLATVRADGKAAARKPFACPRCTTELRHPWGRVQLRQILHARMERARGSATSSELLAPKTLRFDCPECALPIVELRSRARADDAVRT